MIGRRAKSRQIIGQCGCAPPQTDLEAPNLPNSQLDLSRQTYLTVGQVRQYLQISSNGAVYMWAQRHCVPKCRVGRLIRFLRRDVDETVQQTRQLHATKDRQAAS